MTSDVERKLTTILIADVAGSSRHLAAAETAATLAMRRGREVLQGLIQRHRGRIANTAGDGLVADFPSVVEAVACAAEAQRELVGLEAAPGDPIRYRIGIHVGDVIVERGDLLGEAVNLAARLQAMAEPGGVLVSRPVYDHVATKLQVGFETLGLQHPPGFDHDVEVFRLDLGGGPAKRPARRPQPARPRAQSMEPERLAPPPLSAWRGPRGLLFASLALAATNVVTGDAPWAQFPIIIMLTVYGMWVAPRVVPSWVGRTFGRLGALALGLLAMNLATWHGDFWAAWPIGLLAAAFAATRLTRRRG
ncbi:MAG: adenylate/guanylate cyclase domain-containing protein [Pseudomonadota bacterium]